MNEVDRIADWVKGKLVTDATLVTLVAGRVYYSGLIPTNPKFPYIRYHLQDSDDVLAINKQRPFVHSVWFVGAVMQLPAATNPITDIMDRVDAILDRQANNPYSGLLITSERVRAMRPPPDMVSGIYYQESQMLFDVLAQRTA